MAARLRASLPSNMGRFGVSVGRPQVVWTLENSKTLTGDQTALPAELKHISKRRKRNLLGFPKYRRVRLEVPSTESPAVSAAGTVVFGMCSVSYVGCLSPLDGGFIHGGFQTCATPGIGALRVLRVVLFVNAAQMGW